MIAVINRVSDVDSKAIVDQHNVLRAAITHAANMQKMVWDDELAAVAQKWADNCDFKHDDHRVIPGRFFNAGQNLARGQSTWDGAMQRWFNEGRNFLHSNPSMRLEDVGHFTQMVWATSSKIGCGYQKCSNIQGNHFYVCNYGPSGNTAADISKPYIKHSTACSDCPGKCITSGNHAGLCDCNGLTCYNSGTLNLTTCTCTCLQPFHKLSEDCALDCENTKDHASCGSPPFDKCESNTPDYCPHMCDHCPYGAYNYVEKDSPNETSAVTPSSLLGLLAGVMLLLRR
ncbi:CRISP2 [Bugula neritina]|uniref:CRISP2 n=1 Tax=Bugula neritina TaxID=10212 RepID=A0A7J7JEB8_BUGNE|nr:CRISP2 [Bugula neritina]